MLMGVKSRMRPFGRRKRPIFAHSDAPASPHHDKHAIDNAMAGGHAAHTVDGSAAQSPPVLVTAMARDFVPKAPTSPPSSPTNEDQFNPNASGLGPPGRMSMSPPSRQPSLGGESHQSTPQARRHPHMADVALQVMRKVQRSHRYFVNPTSQSKVLWDLFIALLIVYSCIIVPYRIGFAKEAEGAIRIVDILADVAFTIDILVSFRTAFYDARSALVWEAGKIAKHYLRTGFAIDFLSTFPFDLAFSAFAGDSPVLRSAKLLRGLRLVRLLRLMRLLKLGSFFRKYGEDVQINQSVVQLIKMFVLIGFCGHLLACLWFGIGGVDPDNGWRAFLQGESDSLQYTVSLYWAFTTMTTVGYGDINSTNNAERGAALFSMLVGASIFGYVVGNVTVLMEALNPGATLRREKMDLVKEFVRDRKLPPYLAEKVRKHFKYFYSKKSVFEEQTMMENCPPVFRASIAQFGNEAIIARTRLFSKATSTTIAQLIVAMRPFIVPTGTVVFAQGDVCTELFIVNSGFGALLWSPGVEPPSGRVTPVRRVLNAEVLAYSTITKAVRRLKARSQFRKPGKLQEDTSQVKSKPLVCADVVTQDKLLNQVQVGLLKPGDHVGGECVFEPELRLVSLVAAVKSEFFALKKEDLLEHWPDSFEMFSDEVNILKDKLKRLAVLTKESLSANSSPATSPAVSPVKTPASQAAQASPPVRMVAHAEEPSQPLDAGVASPGAPPTLLAESDTKHADGPMRLGRELDDKVPDTRRPEGVGMVELQHMQSPMPGQLVVNEHAAAAGVLAAGDADDDGGDDEIPGMAPLRPGAGAGAGAGVGQARAANHRLGSIAGGLGSGGLPASAAASAPAAMMRSKLPRPEGITPLQTAHTARTARVHPAGADAGAGDPDAGAGRVLVRRNLSLSTGSQPLAIPPHLRSLRGARQRVDSARNLLQTVDARSDGHRVTGVTLHNMLNFAGNPSRDSPVPRHLQHTDSWMELKKQEVEEPGASPSSRAIFVDEKTPQSETTSSRRIVQLQDSDESRSWCQRHTIHPNNPWKMRWDIVLTVTIMYSAISVPYRVGFDDEATGGWFIVDLLSDVIFFIDIVTNMFTGYTTDMGVVIREPRRIVTHYLKGWFTIDVASTIPFDLVAGLIIGAAQTEQWRMMKLLRTLRLFKLSRFLKLQKMFGRYEDVINTNPLVLRMFKLLFIMVFIAHLNGCLWFGIVSQTGHVNNWTVKYCQVVDDVTVCLNEQDLVSQYISSVYWAFTTMTTVGYGDVSPDASNRLELVVAMLSMVMGTAVFAHVITSVMNMVVNFDPAERLTKQSLVQLSDYMREKQLPVALRRQVRSHYRHYLEFTSVLPQTSLLLDTMPYPLKRELIGYMHKRTFLTIPLFRRMERRFPGLLAALVQAIQPSRLAKNATVCRLHDTARVMYIVASGAVHIYNERQELIRDAVDGQYFNECAIWISETATFQTRISARAALLTHLFTLSRNDMLTLRHSLSSTAADYLEAVLKAEQRPEEWASEEEDPESEEEETKEHAAGGTATGGKKKKGGRKGRKKGRVGKFG